ncbi:MAG TPA: hypothetical protein VNW92_15455, partial [Polyangiaceae bacterium]|nr:hypothetical protein [Polyangiaceae bacterium]
VAGSSGSASGGTSGAASGGAASGGTAGGGAAGSAGQATGGASGSGGGGASGGSGGASTGQAFLPDVTYKYVGMGPNAGVTIVAGTIDGNGELGPEWLLAMKGAGPDPVCIITVSADLLDASNQTLAHVDVIVDSPIYTSFGSPTQCIGKGDIGMGQANVTFDSGDLSQVTQINYGFNGNIDPDATKLVDVTADGIMIADFSAKQKKVTGAVTNHSTSTTYKYPGLALYPVDGAGRPLARGEALSSNMLTPGGTFDFTMYVNSPIDTYVTFPEYEGL